MLLINALAFLALSCMLVTLVCIVFKRAGNLIPTIISVCGSIFYAMFFVFARQNMDSSAQHMYSLILLAFVGYTVVAYGMYMNSKAQKKEARCKRLAEFKRQCAEARGA